jgi:cell division protein ZapA
MFKVKVIIDGRTYTLSAEEQDGYIEKVAEYVDSQVQQIKSALHTSSVDSATMAAMNIADKYYKAQDGTDGLRLQVRDYAEECARLRAEVARLKKEAKKA